MYTYVHMSVYIFGMDTCYGLCQYINAFDMIQICAYVRI